MTVSSARSRALFMAGVAMLCASTAFAIDPQRNPRRDVDPIVPNPADAYSTSPYSIPGTFPGLGNNFDPFAPQPTTPNELRVRPNVVPQPITPAEPPRWRLGIFSTDTGTGAQVVRVREGSPAHQAGLEPDDTIVCVSGTQVGIVHGHIHQLGQAFNQHADTQGWVDLLVHDNRSGNLLNIPVHLEPRFERIQGTIGFQNTVRLPTNAEATIVLQEITRTGFPQEIARKRITNLRQNPIQFALDFDPALIDGRRQYVVHAEVHSGSQTVLTTRQPYQVITDGYPQTVDIRMYPTQYGGNGHYVGYADNREEQLEQIVQWYRDYLHRDPRFNERAVWQSHFDRGGSMEEVQADLLAHNEFYMQANRDDRRYIENMYMAVLNRRPQNEEVDAWLRRLQQRNGLRLEIAKEFLAAVSQPR